MIKSSQIDCKRCLQAVFNQSQSLPKVICVFHFKERWTKEQTGGQRKHFHGHNGGKAGESKRDIADDQQGKIMLTAPH